MWGFVPEVPDRPRVRRAPRRRGLRAFVADHHPRRAMLACNEGGTMAAPAVAGHGPRVGAPPGAQPSGVCRPRRPRASPLYGLLDRCFRHLRFVYDERFAPTYGPWRRHPTVVDRFLACGLLEHGFARIRCDACAHEYLLAFSCKGRYFCPSCHAKRLARWTLWLDETLLAPVPHRQVVLTIPKRLRP